MLLDCNDEKLYIFGKKSSTFICVEAFFFVFLCPMDEPFLVNENVRKSTCVGQFLWWANPFLCLCAMQMWPLSSLWWQAAATTWWSEKTIRPTDYRKLSTFSRTFGTTGQHQHPDLPTKYVTVKTSNMKLFVSGLFFYRCQ